MSRQIHIGIGGWVFEEWRGAFYPAGLPQKRELEYAGQHLTSIEVNGTYYGSQKPDSFLKWAEEVPEDFVFALKGPRFATNRRVLAEAGPSVEKFLATGLTGLGKKLGPINWQFAATKKFEPDDFAAFLALLPREAGGRQLRHAVEVRHPSFAHPDFVGLCRDHGVAIVTAGDSEFPCIPDPTADFVYARIMGTRADQPQGYDGPGLDLWAARAGDWAAGRLPRGLAPVAAPPSETAREVFLYVISGAKARNPAAAMALIERAG